MQQAIQPGDQMLVNVASLIRNRLPDRKGNVLPADLAFGTYDVKDLASGGGSLSIGALTLDKTFGFHASPPSPDCCANYGDYLHPGSIWVDVDGFVDVDVKAMNACTGQLQSILGDISDWWSGDTGIAQVAKAKVTGVAAGTTTANGSGLMAVCVGNTLFWENIYPTAPVTVAPTITSISPSQGLVGTPITVTINGTGFSSGGTVSAGPNIAVSNVSFSSSTKITATFTPSNSSTAGGNQAITVSVSSQPSNAQNFYVQIPTHFQFATVPGAPGGQGPVTPVTNGNVVNLNGQILATSYCGVYENFAYEFLDQQFNAILNGTATVTEVFTNISPPPGPTPSVNTINFATQGDTDTQAYGGTYPAYCLKTNQNQSLNYSYTVRVGSTAYPLSTVVSITKGNFNGALNVSASITTP
jgi:hypothetical protein